MGILRGRRIFSLPIALLLFCAFLVHGQEQTGEIIGTVFLEGGSVILGVKVEITGTNLVGRRTTVSDEMGIYRFPNLGPGGYTLNFTSRGFKSLKRDQIFLHVGQKLKVDVKMQTGRIEETVLVSGQSPLVDVRQSSTSRSINKEILANLPKGRDFSSVITFQAGINEEPEGDGIHFDGASASENTFYVNGTNATQLLYATGRQGVFIDQVEEVQVKSSGYAAEYGGSMGGVISVITRSGGNEFRGDLTLYLDHNALNGSPNNPLAIDPINSTALYDEIYKDRWVYLEPGISLGGYVIKDRLWFYTSFMPRFRSINRPFRHLELDASGNRIKGEYDGEEIPYNSTNLAGSAKITAALSDNIRLTLSSTLDYYKTEGSLPGTNGFVDYRPDDWADEGYTFPGVTVSGSLDFSLGKKLFILISGGNYYWDRFYSGTADKYEYRLVFARSNTHLDISDELKKPGGYENCEYTQISSWDKTKNSRFNLKADLTYYFNAGGEHMVKAGFGVERAALDILVGQNQPNWTFYWTQPNGDWATYQKVDGSSVDLTYGAVRSLVNNTMADVSTYRYSIYLQDSWTIGSRLTLNFGIRMEKEEFPSPSRERPEAPFNFDFFDKVQPRIGFAWDMGGDGRNKLYGSFGLYHDVMKFMLLGRYGMRMRQETWYDLAAFDWKQYGTYQGYIWTGSQEPILGGQFLEWKNYVEPAHNNTQPDLKPFSKMEITLGYSRMLGSNLAFNARFLYNEILNAIESIGIRVGTSTTFYFGNPGSDWVNDLYAQAALDGYIPAGRTCPPPVRRYMSLQLALEKKLSHNWLGSVSLTLSRLYGNFSGLSDSDLAGHTPNVGQSWDSWFLHYEADGKTESLGLLQTDRPFDLKIYGAYSFDFGVTIGMYSYFKSGTPISRLMVLNDLRSYHPLGRNSDGRMPFLWNVDLFVEYNWKLSETINLNINANVTNLFDTRIAVQKDRTWFYRGIQLDNDTINQGFDAAQVAAEKGIPVNPSFLWDSNWQRPISVRLGLRLSF